MPGRTERNNDGAAVNRRGLPSGCTGRRTRMTRGPAPPEGFAEFVAARSHVLLRAAWLLTGDAGRAEDLLQTALARSWQQWDRIAEGGNPEGYVRRVLYNTY